MLVNTILIENTMIGDCDYCGADLKRFGALTLRVETAENYVERNICPLCLIETFDKACLGQDNTIETTDDVPEV